MEQINEAKVENGRVNVGFTDGTRLLIPEYELVKIKSQGTSKISKVRDILTSIVVSPA